VLGVYNYLQASRPSGSLEAGASRLPPRVPRRPSSKERPTVVGLTATQAGQIVQYIAWNVNGGEPRSDARQ